MIIMYDERNMKISICDDFVSNMFGDLWDMFSASSLVSRKLFRAYIDQHFSNQNKWFQKTRNNLNGILP